MIQLHNGQVLNKTWLKMLAFENYFFISEKQDYYGESWSTDLLMSGLLNFIYWYNINETVHGIRTSTSNSVS